MKRFYLCIFISFFSANIQAQDQVFSDPNFTYTTLNANWDLPPLGAAYTKDAQRLFVWEKKGLVYVCNKSGNTYAKQATPVIDLNAEVLNWDDNGLLGFALDPDFLTNGYIYLLYAVDRRFLMSDNSIVADVGFAATIGRVTRYKTILSGSNIVADLATRTVLIGETKETGIPLLCSSHGVGSLVFAADGTLLVSAGDGADFDKPDSGNNDKSFFAQALADGIIRPEENVGAFRAQLLNSHNGKLLRIDPATGDGVASNPFYSATAPRSPKSRVWALGLRNPFRFTIKPASGSTNPATGDIGEVFVGDVGWENWEDFNIVTGPGMNFGWPIYEGQEINTRYIIPADTTLNKDEPNPLAGETGCTKPFFTFRELLKNPTADGNTTIYNPCNNLVEIGSGTRYVHSRPSLAYAHTQNSSRVGIFSGNNPQAAEIGTPESGVVGTPFQGFCVVAGLWYTGNQFPAAYKDKFFLADWFGKWVRLLSIDFTDRITKVDNFAPYFEKVVCMAENPIDGTVAVVSMGFPTVGILKYGGNQPPVAKPVANITYGSSPLTVNFTGNTSFDPTIGGSIASYSWDFGDGVPATSTAINPGNVVFTEETGNPKKFVVKLTVTDNGGATHTDSVIISVNNTPPVVNITSPVHNSTYEPGSDTTYSCTADVTDNEHLPSQLKYEWQTFFRHNTHEHTREIDNNVVTTTRISRVGCNGDTYSWFIRLKVTDDAGLFGIDSAQLFPDCTVGPDITPPTVSSTSPVNSATGISTGTTVTATFNEVIDASTVTGITFQLKDAGNNGISASVNTASNQIILTPSAALANSTTYTATISGGATGVKDPAGNALVNDFTWTFTTTADNTAPTVISVSPAGGATGAGINATVTANFSEAVNGSTVTGTTFQLKDAGNNVIPASVSTVSNQITLTPSAALTNSTAYTVTIKGGGSGVKNLAGNALVNDYSWSFTTEAAASSTMTIFQPNSVPANPLNHDGQGIELGVKFRSTQNGFITGIRYYKGAGTTGTHIGHLWSNTGTPLATATFTNETASGWQQVLFSSPVAITAGVTYVASQYSPSGHYASTVSYFTQAVINGPLRGLAGGEDGINGLYKYSATSTFPTFGHLSSNYWVDVVFTTNPGGDITAPIVLSALPAPASTEINTGTTITAIFNEGLNASTVDGTTVQLKDADDNIVAASVSVNASSNQIILTPSVPLAVSTLYTATIKSGISGVRDLAGNALTGDYTWSFTTGIGTLPILLHKFSVTQNGSVNLVKWTTELESNMDYFDLERSTDGINFQAINRQAANNIAGTSYYSFADNNFSPGMIYYRLKIVEYGGIIEYSIIIRVASENENNELKIVPNPVRSNFYLSYHSSQEGIVTIEINDITGRLIHTLKENVNKGQNIIYIRSSATWHDGVYFMIIKNRNGTRQVKFVKAQY